ncbi:MAG TPA: SRPBCC domain-containing protein [Pseudonocardiaceae bacterium]|nr:SRPBCC domain-containing protein [Pseudonocardiaceae bacterium]
MNHPFEINEQITVNATPDQVWDAIATGPGIDSWFMGHSEVEPREGGRNTMTMFDSTTSSTITAWEPGRRFAFRGQEDPEDGTFMAFEYLVEGRGDGTSVIRFAHSGLLAGDDWEGEYDALREGDPMYLRKLATYLAYFAGRTANCNIFVPGPPATDQAGVWQRFGSALGVSGELTEGASATIALPGLPVDEGVVAFAREPGYVGVRTADGMYVLMNGYRHGVFVEYHGFGKADDEQQAFSAWQSWLATAFA